MIFPKRLESSHVVNLSLTPLTQALTLLRRYTGERKGSGSKNLQISLSLSTLPLVSVVSPVFKKKASHVRASREYKIRCRSGCEKVLIRNTLENRVYVPLRTPDRADGGDENVLTICSKTT